MEQTPAINQDEAQFSEHFESLLSNKAERNKTTLIIFYCVYTVVCVFYIASIYPVFRFLLTDYQLGINHGTTKFVTMVVSILLVITTLVLLGLRRKLGWGMTVIILIPRVFSVAFYFMHGIKTIGFATGLVVGTCCWIGLVVYLLTPGVQRMFGIKKSFRLAVLLIGGVLALLLGLYILTRR